VRRRVFLPAWRRAEGGGVQARGPLSQRRQGRRSGGALSWPRGRKKEEGREGEERKGKEKEKKKKEKKGEKEKEEKKEKERRKEKRKIEKGRKRNWEKFRKFGKIVREIRGRVLRNFSDFRASARFPGRR
jgi:hypothetical protein